MQENIQPRKPKGAPGGSGGQFSRRNRAPADTGTTLTGYTSATQQVASTGEIAQFFHAAQKRLNEPVGKFPVLAFDTDDEYRARNKATFNGHTYVTLSPDTYTVHEFMRQHNNATVDVPVTARIGDETVTGFVRVSATGARTFTTVTNSFGTEHDAAIAELTAASLERRTPAPLFTKLPEVNQGAKLVPTYTKSSLVQGVGFDESTSTMTVDLNGRTYAYESTREDYEALKTSQSPGRTYGALFRGKATPVTVTKCGTCSRYARTDMDHTCTITRTVKLPNF